MRLMGLPVRAFQPGSPAAPVLLNQQRLRLDLNLLCQDIDAPLDFVVIPLLESFLVLKMPELVLVLQCRRL